LRNLSEVAFEEVNGKSFEIMRVVEMLCEVCGKPLSTRTKLLRTVQISSEEDYRNLLSRAAVHDRAEIDIGNSKIYFYDHDYPGDAHDECLARL
jgi:hypothetical protein